TSAAPKELSGARAAATCDLGWPCVSAPAWTDRADLRAAATADLEKEPADALAAWMLARAAMGDDRQVSRVAVDRAVLRSAAGARARAEEALRAAPGRCETLQLLVDLSRRGGPAADQRKYAEMLLGCTDGLSTAAQAARSRGDLARAESLFKLSAALRPAQPSRLEQLADVQTARKELPSA